MSNGRLALIFAILTLLCLVALLPLRLALAGTDMAARNVEGSVWNGRLQAAVWRGVALGDVSLGLSPLPLLIGQRRIDFEAGDLSGRVLTGGGRLAVEGLGGIAAPGQLGGLPVARINFADFAAVFEDDRCLQAAGSLTLDPGGPLAALGGFSGSPRCDGARLLLPLQGQGGRLDLHLSADARYDAGLALETVDPAARPGLLAAGFQPTPTGLALTLTGSLR
jgi:general secretion pathway protein N